LEFTFFDLVELFGPEIWERRKLFQQEITIVNNQFNLKETERRLIINALELCNFKQREAAQLLGISQRSLNYWIKNNNYTHPSWRVNV
jgi:transcriptional regulator with GAF, ATPase, and Fis domain